MNRTVLVIEDDPAMRDNVKEILELSNYNVETAINGKEGLEKAQKMNPSIILCDSQIPELDGYGVLRGLSNHPATKRIPFIIVTPQTEQSEIRKGMDMGADDYLIKPFSGSELLSLISIRLKKAESMKNGPIQMEYNDSMIHEGFLKNIGSLGEKIFLKRIRKKDFVFTEEDTANYLYFIISGKIKTSKCNEQGKEYITHIYGQNEFLGYSAFLKNGKYEETAVAIEDAEIAGIYMRDFFSFLNDHQELIASLIHTIAVNFLEQNNKLIGLAYNSARKRTAEAILYIAKKYDEQLCDNLVIQVSRDDLSAISGVSPESVSRNLTDFRNEHIIEHTNGRLKILDFKKLIHLKN